MTEGRTLRSDVNAGAVNAAIDMLLERLEQDAGEVHELTDVEFQLLHAIEDGLLIQEFRRYYDTALAAVEHHARELRSAQSSFDEDRSQPEDEARS